MLDYIIMLMSKVNHENSLVEHGMVTLHLFVKSFAVDLVIWSFLVLPLAHLHHFFGGNHCWHHSAICRYRYLAVK